MSGAVFKRCSTCGHGIKNRTCHKCGSSSTTWAFRAYVGKRADGRWVEQLRSGFATKRDASHALYELVTSLQQGTYVRPSKLTVAEFLLDEWLPSTAPPRVKYETWKDRERNLKAHVIPQLGGLSLQELNAAHLNRLYTELLQSGRVHQEGGLSPTSVRRIHAMVRKALNDAVRWGHVRHNAATFADPPSDRIVRAARRRSMQTWDERELSAFLTRTEGHYLHPMWVLAASTSGTKPSLDR